MRDNLLKNYSIGILPNKNLFLLSDIYKNEIIRRRSLSKNGGIMKENKTKKNSGGKKAIIITVVSVVLAVLIIVPTVAILVSKRGKPIDFLMKNDLSKYVSVDIGDKLDYNKLKETLKSGYDVFRVGLTEVYFENTAYVEEGSTIDFTLSAEIITKKEDGSKEYTAYELPEKYKKTEGYRPFSDKSKLFFDNALANTGNINEYNSYYLVRNKEAKFDVTMPVSEEYGELSGKDVRFTIKVTDYVARYICFNGQIDSSLSIIAEWFAETAVKKTENNAGNAVSEGDVVLYDCIDKMTDGTVKEYKDVKIEATGDHLKYFEGKVAGDKFTQTIDGVEEEFEIKEVHKAEDIKAALKDMGYASVFDYMEELRIWCYAVHSDGILAIICQSTELSEYPKNLFATYKKIEDDTWEKDFRTSAKSMADTWGDSVAFEAYGISGYNTFDDYLEELLYEHTKTVVRELVISFALADDMGILDGMYEEYNKSLKEFMKANDYSKNEALSSLSYNGDEAYVFCASFLSPALGIKLAGSVTGAEFIDILSDSYMDVG